MLEGIKRSAVVRTAMAVQERFGRDAGGNMAGAISYFGFLSLFPLLLLGLSVVGFILAGNAGLRDQVAVEVSRAVPGLEALAGNNIRALIKARAGAAAIGLVGLLWTGTGVVAASETALGRMFGVRDKVGFVREKARQLGTTVALGIVALAGTAVVGGARAIDAGGFARVALAIGAIVLGLAIDFGLFSAAYRLLIRRPGPAWRHLWPGALLAAGGWTVLKFIGAWYGARTLSRASAIYGTFAGAVAVLVLLNLAARFFVYGGELIAFLKEREEEGSRVGGDKVEREDGKPRELDPQDRSTIRLVSQVAGDVGALVKKEVELAKQEISEGIAARLKAAVALGIVAVLGLFALGFAAAAIAWALDGVMPPWASRLVVAGIFLVLGAVAAVFGIQRLKSPPLKPVKTQETIKEDVAWAKAQLKR